jgi:hypothetical protein
MKKIALPILSILIALSCIFMFSGFNKRSSGSPAGKTGSPADASDCTSCHGGTATTATGILSSNIPVSGYTPGSSYTITVTLTGSGNKGFEVSPQNVAGTLLGSLTAGTGTKFPTGSTKYITHSAVKSSNPAVWTFTWVAPASGTGDVTFYGAFTITEPVTKLSTMVVNESSSASIVETDKTGSNFIVYPNLVTNTLNINYNVTDGGNVSLQLFDIYGRMVIDILEENISSNGSKTKSVSIGNEFKTGVYFLRYTDGKNIETKKIVVN